jgi:hypothetical protein
MQLPVPRYRAYAEFVVTAVVVMGIGQYLGVSEPAGHLDITMLMGTTLTLPVFTYLFTVILENINMISQWDRMVKQRE